MALLDCGTASVAQARANVVASVAQLAYLDQWSRGTWALWRQCRFESLRWQIVMTIGLSLCDVR